MNSKICISLGGLPFTTCLHLASEWPFVEIRLDRIEINPEKIKTLAAQCRRWIATCRADNRTDSERTALLASAIRAGATYVDIEYEAAGSYRRTLTDLAKQHGCKVIISYHNFDTTPGVDTLNHIITHAKEMSADCVKIAVTAHSPADSARVMSLYGHHSSILAFAMGNAGKITRMAAPFLGAEFTYASVSEAYMTAPGQLTASQMEIIYRILNGYEQAVR